ncbi:MAG: hypothetical protein AB1898_31520, partial [Acidobacteriota bacterium]
MRPERLEPSPDVAVRKPEPGIYRDVILDVRDQAVRRGETPRPKKLPEIPRGRLNLSIYLPFA